VRRRYIVQDQVKMRALLAFFTVLPIRAPGSTLEDAARKAYLLPLIGLLAGLPGAALLLLAYAVPSGVATTLALGTTLLVAGLHHTDGVMDVGDALMVRGSPERRREVLKDTRIGAGAAGALFIVYGPPLAALAALAVASPPRAAAALLAGEVVARSAMLLLLLFGSPAEARSSSMHFVRSLKKRSRRSAALVLALVLPLLIVVPLAPYALLATLASLATAPLALVLAKRVFGGISGDVVGATGELARAVLLIALSAVVS
jgi:adenosylcobinamide-GDP ribazoletransferase